MHLLFARQPSLVCVCVRVYKVRLAKKTIPFFSGQALFPLGQNHFVQHEWTSCKSSATFLRLPPLFYPAFWLSRTPEISRACLSFMIFSPIA